MNVLKSRLFIRHRLCSNSDFDSLFFNLTAFYQNGFETGFIKDMFINKGNFLIAYN